MQLQNEMRLGRIFKGYQEGPVTFLPTYKYDVGTQLYDTSEKARIPGWTDRIVYKGNDLKLLQYTRAELLTSDHRPVLALFEADVRFACFVCVALSDQVIIDCNIRSCRKVETSKRIVSTEFG